MNRVSMLLDAKTFRPSSNSTSLDADMLPPFRRAAAARRKGGSMSASKLVEFDDGLKVFASSSMETRFIYDEIFRLGCYDGIRLPQRPLVIDVGANIGMFAL